MTIKVADYYGNNKYYGFMPRPMFAALERAFVSGSPLATIGRADFSSMLTAYHAACTE